MDHLFAPPSAAAAPGPPSAASGAAGAAVATSPPFVPLLAARFPSVLQRSLQYFTSSQHFSHAFRLKSPEMSGHTSENVVGPVQELSTPNGGCRARLCVQ